MKQEKTLRIYFTSDVHGYFYPISYSSGQKEAVGLMCCAGQYQKDGNTLILDGGDMLQGSPLAAYCHDCLNTPAPMAQCINLSGYDFVALGNHDFNFGPEYQLRYVQALSAQCLCQNLLDETGAPMYPYAIKTMENGLRIGIVGIVTDYVNIWEKPEHLEHCSVVDPFESARQALIELKPQTDLTICIYHGGFERDLATGNLLSNTTENIGYRICQELDFDLLLTGHQHMSVSGQSVCGTYVVQPVENGREFHHITVTVGETIRFTSQLCKPDGPCPQQLTEALDPVQEALQHWLDSDVGVLEHAMRPDSHLNMALHGSEIAALFNAIQMDFTGAQISVTSLANEIAGFPQHVRRRDILTTYPYQNTLTVLEMTGAQVRAALERSAEYFALNEQGEIVISDAFLKPKIEHYNYDYYAGITYEFDISQPVGHRVSLLQFEGADVTDDTVFSVCVSDYRASGAGAYPMYPACKTLRVSDTEMSDIITHYFEAHPQLPPLPKPNYRVYAGQGV